MVAPELNPWISIAYGNGIIMAVANTGANALMTSTDGLTWTSYNSISGGNQSSIAFGNGLFVVVKNGAMLFEH